VSTAKIFTEKNIAIMLKNKLKREKYTINIVFFCFFEICGWRKKPFASRIFGGIDYFENVNSFAKKRELTLPYSDLPIRTQGP
jgi:hypothetical protein